MKFLQQAYQGNQHGGSYILTLLIVFFFWQVLGVLPLFGVAIYYAEGDIARLMETADTQFLGLGINLNLYLIVMLSSFLIGFIGLVFALKSVHKRKLRSIFTSRKKIDYKRIGYSFLIWFLVSGLIISYDYNINPEAYQLNFEASKFAILLLIAIVLIPFQTTFEELLFRGYLMQGFGLLFKRPILAILVTSVIFGLLHSLNPEVAKLGYGLLFFYIATGFFLGLITVLDEGTELAIGFHAANNMAIALLLTSEWSAFKTNAVLKSIEEPSLNWEMYIPVFVLYPILFLLFSKKYKWKNYRKIFSRIEKPIELDEKSFIA